MILVHGAGAIGQYVGGRLAQAGARVLLVGRPAAMEPIRRQGLSVATLGGAFTPAGSTLDVATRLPVDLRLESTPDAARFGQSAALELVLLTVKCGATVKAAAELAAVLPAGTPVLSLQNGVDNVRVLQSKAPMLTPLAGMVPYNVVIDAPAQVRQATDGMLMVERHPATEALAALARRGGLALAVRDDIAEVQWGKLLLNLNNPVNALSGLPLRTQLLDAGYRRVLAGLIAEALGVLTVAGIRPARVTPLPPTWLPSLLRLPTPLFRLLAARMLKIAPEARSSMQDDRRAGRATEIDALCGAIIRLADRHRLPSPQNTAMRRLVETLPSGRSLAAAELAAALEP